MAPTHTHTRARQYAIIAKLTNYLFVFPNYKSFNTASNWYTKLCFPAFGRVVVIHSKNYDMALT